MSALPSLSRPSTGTLYCWLVSAFLFCCLVLGGGPGGLQDYVLQIASLSLILLAVWRASSQVVRWDVPMLMLMVGFVLLAALQLVPLPPSIWHSLGGRAELVKEMATAGIQASGWHALSLNPAETERSLFWVLPGIATYLSACVMNEQERIRLVVVVFAVALFSLLIEVGQVAGGQNGILRFYGNDLQFAADGFFSNRNHLACMLAMTIPLAFALLVTALKRRVAGRYVSVAWLLFLVMTIASLLIALPVNGSRVAVILGALAILGSFAMLLRANLARRVMLALTGVGLLAVVLTVQIGVDRVLVRFQKDPVDDARWLIHATTLKAADHFGPLGSGLGTFVSAYQAVMPQRELGSSYANFAHSDYHQLWLETGIPGVALILMFVAWFAWRGTRAWTLRTRPYPALVLGWAATISILVVLGHSWLDYPLRKTAIIALTGLCCALLSSARFAPKPESKRARELRHDDDSMARHPADSSAHS